MPAYSRRTVAEFMTAEPTQIVGELIVASGAEGFADHRHRQTTAWQREIESLRACFTALAVTLPDSNGWSVLLEYPIPRRQKRVDTVILTRDVIFCLEFKTEDRKHSADAQRQVEDYALDLRDFHAQSRGRIIVPIAIASRATVAVNCSPTNDAEPVRQVLKACDEDLHAVLTEAFSRESEPHLEPLDAAVWDNSAYRPVPTIIEAARALYGGHDVREIAHSHAGAINLTLTSDRLVSLIQEAREHRRKTVCFVTGVPGAGKTLAGLNVVHSDAARCGDIPAPIFLSGNGPLVKIVAAAITRDRTLRTGDTRAGRTVSTFIQNVHHFVRHAAERPDEPPVERVVVFDEAQRAWNATQNAKKTGATISEPTSVLRIMDRHSEWAVVIALIGGGQEINSGEAGIEEWGRSLQTEFRHWHIAVSPSSLTGDASVAGHRLFPDGVEPGLSIREEPSLHLNVSIRAFRAEQLNRWVNAVLVGEAEQAALIAAEMREFPIRLSRSLSVVRAWLREKARGLRRCGLLASSGGMRLRADGVEVSSGFRQGNRDLYTHWFLADIGDVRASNQLEVAATEFECQGLELDWTGVCWAGDFVFDRETNAWRYQTFAGTRWREVPRSSDRAFMLNTYRVLLTRAREGLAIWIPPGDVNDPTRLPQPFDSTADYLFRCGAVLL